MIYLTGDIHGFHNLDKARLDFINQNLTDQDILLVLGDLGLWSRGDVEKAFFPCTVISILGNHENYSFLETMETVDLYSAKCIKLSNNIYFAKNGEILDIEGFKFFCFGGALSIDKSRRIPYVSWWPQEIPSTKECKDAISNLERINYKFDFFLAHTCPEEVIHDLFFYSYKTNDPVERILSKLEYEIRSNGNTNYKFYFGHHHTFTSDGIHNCLYKNIMKLSTEKKDFEICNI